MVVNVGLKWTYEEADSAHYKVLRWYWSQKWTNTTKLYSTIADQDLNP
jgi:hypothetical protein